MTRIAAAALFALLNNPTISFAEMLKAGDLHITDQWVREAPKSAKTGAGYLTIKNNGTVSDVLFGVEADFPRVIIHGTKTESGVKKMYHVDNLAIDAGQTVALQPGGFHIMFMGLDGTGLPAGGSVTATLNFKNSGGVEVSFPIRPIN